MGEKNAGMLFFFSTGARKTEKWELERIKMNAETFSADDFRGQCEFQKICCKRIDKCKFFIPVPIACEFELIIPVGA